MIIFGTRGVRSTINKGTFDCPQCESHQDYKHKKVRNFFTLYFIPVIPLGHLGEYVECQKCRGTFVPKVLDYNKNADSNKFLSEYEKAIKHCMVLIMLADGEIDDNEMLMVQVIFNRFSHNDITMEELESYVKEVEENPEHPSTYLKKIAPSLNYHGKTVVIQSALSVAASDGNIDPSQLQEVFDKTLKPKEAEFSNN